MPEKEIFCTFQVDVDAVAGWLGSYGGEDSPDDISRGMFAGEVGSPRLLRLFEKFDLRTTWFIPGHSIETFPEQMKQVVADVEHSRATIAALRADREAASQKMKALQHAISEQHQVALKLLS